MRPIRPIALPDAARPFALPLGPGPWVWRWGGWMVEGDGRRILRMARGEREVSGPIPWPEDSGNGFSALPGRIDGAAAVGEDPLGPTLLLPPGGDTAVLIAGGKEILLSSEGSGSAVTAAPRGPGPSSLPMHAHRPLRTALETVGQGLQLQAPGIDAGPALFWAAATAAASEAAFTATEAAPSDPLGWEPLLANLALGQDIPQMDALERLLHLDPRRGLQAAGTVGEWRDAVGVLAGLKDSLIESAEALISGAAGATLGKEEISALVTAAAAMEGAGLRRGAAAIRGRLGSATAPGPIVGRAEALDHIRAEVDAFAEAPLEWVCDEGLKRRRLFQLPPKILFGFLGAHGDAPFGRLRLAPTLAHGIETFEARGIRLGAARARVRYRLDETGHTFTVEQSDGPVPLNVVLDLGLPDRPVRTWIDGEPAEVDVTVGGGGFRARLQMPLDRPRQIRMERGA